MLFTSWAFLVFLPVVWILHFAVRDQRWQIAALILASFVFYGWSHPGLITLLAAAAFVNSEVARRLLDVRRDPTQRRQWMWIGIAANLGSLLYFKYGGLIADVVLPASWKAAWLPYWSKEPPIGISFFTFQGISLVVDLHRAGSGGVPGLRPPTTGGTAVDIHRRIWFFKAFFPQLIAGPIVKAGEFLHQIGTKTLTDIPWTLAAKQLIAGFFLKMVVADNLKEVTASLKYPLFLGLPKLNLIALLYGFSAQIFADFCGYSLIAMGLASLFGYSLPENFRQPYLARSLTEFWRRWHISLSSWLREYLYFPLGGNRHGTTRTFLNLFLVMFLGGLWHGAQWKFAVWGIAHGLLLAVERACGVQGDPSASDRGWTITGTLRSFGTFTIVSILWLLFQLDHLSEAGAYLRCIAMNPMGVQPQGVFVIALFSLPVWLHHLARDWYGPGLGRGPAAGISHPFETAVYATMLALVVINSGTPGEFIYFQF